jgi:integrase/recombinase XerD
METHESQLIRDEVRAFLVDRRARRLSEKTVDFYSYYLNILLSWCAANSVSSMADLTPVVLRACLADFGEAHNGGGVHCLYRCIKALCLWYERESDLPWPNPIRKVAAPKMKRDPIPGVSIDDVRCMIGVCVGYKLARRDKALLKFLLDTGLRAGECLALDIDDIDIASGTVQVKNGKGNKDRVAFFGTDTANDLRRYVRARVREQGALWLDQSGERLEYAGLRGIIRRRAHACGLKDVPSPHDFRRAFALESLRNGMDLLAVSRLLGHESLEVTKRYLSLLDEDLHKAHREAAPVDRMRNGKAR